MEEAMEFMKYDKITDDVYILGPEAVLKFNVSLSKIDTSNSRHHFYKEFEYPTRASGYNSLLTIKRSFDYYLSIENPKINKELGEKAFIRIGPYDLYKIQSQLKEVYEWFTSSKYSKLYMKSGNRICITNPIPETTLGGYPQGKFLRFIPTIIEDDSGRTARGVELDLSNYDNFVIMSIDKFMGFYYTIMNFNMYLAAQNLVGYIGFPSGQNRTNFSSSYNVPEHTISGEEYKGKVSGINNRTIGKKKNISSLE